ncbi:hypothetical protein [Calothrix sp. PCC 6303]|uniref:hypothetical protein n=2 Tax=Calothrix sp. PCC 6303 TaxID=1170562 RepID=UPI0002A048FF|nr:hypothetical protein [Calothrix sp. PCC 6303]AFZ01338.1 hypothetical protein Cal6303_2322 [Calothrix sp. PCC 6303]
MRVKKYLSPNDYYSYMNSNAWRSKHYNWLKRCHYRCSMFPWVRIGRYSSKKYGKYNIHHTGVGYRHLGQEELWKDVLPLCPFAHWLIHGGNMKAKAPWQPNLIQKFLHLWCSLPLLVKRLILLVLGLAIASAFPIYITLIMGAIIFYLLFY